MIWFEQAVSIEKPMAEELRFALKIPLYGRIISCALALIGALLVISVVINDYMDRNSRVSDQDGNQMKIRPTTNGGGTDITEANEKLPEGSPLLQKQSLFKNISFANQYDNKKKKNKWTPENSTETSYIRT